MELGEFSVGLERHTRYKASWDTSCWAPPPGVSRAVQECHPRESGDQVKIFSLLCGPRFRGDDIFFRWSYSPTSLISV